MTLDDAEAVAAAHAEVAEQHAQKGVSAERGPTWLSLGPTTIPNGQTRGYNRVNMSGRVSSVDVEPNDGSHLLVGAATGGVWESFDSGASWSPRTDAAATLSVGALARDPRSPKVVYCGTGEGSGWWFLGYGVLRSEDGGTTWSQLCTSPFVGQGIYDLVVDPGDSSRLLAAATNGLYVSTDGGVTWTRPRSSRTWSLTVAPGGAAIEVLAACADGLFRSADAGRTWTAVSLPGTKVPEVWTRLDVAIAPSEPATAYAWGAAKKAYLWRRVKGVWSAVSSLPPDVNLLEAWYDWCLAVDPERDTLIYCGAVDVHRGDLSGSSPSWLNLTTKGLGEASIYPNQHAIAFDPKDSSAIYVGNDGGLYRSPDRGVTWTHCNNGLVITDVEFLAQDLSSPQWVIAGTLHTGTNRWTGDPVWTHVADGDGGHPGVNQANPNVVFHTFDGLDNVERSRLRGNWQTWSQLNPPLVSGDDPLPYPPLDCGAPAGDTLAMGGKYVYISRDNGSNWSAPLAVGRGIAKASAISVPAPDAIYVGTNEGAILVTTWDGTNWTSLTELTRPRPAAYISDLYVEPTGRQRLWATSTTVGGGRVFRSDDGGMTWSDRTANLPNLPINAIAVHSANPDNVWVAADVSVYETGDGGGSWHVLGVELPNAPVGDIVYHPSRNVLRAGLRGRGLWELPVRWPELAVAAYGYSEAAGGWRVDKHPRFMADTTGDGRADIVGFGRSYVYVTRSLGDGQWAAGQVGYNGSFCLDQGWSVANNPRMLADTTGDRKAGHGKADIVGFGDDGVWVARANGDGTFAQAELAVAWFGYSEAAGGWRVEKNPRCMADPNANGRAQVVGFGDSGVYVTRY